MASLQNLFMDSRQIYSKGSQVFFLQGQDFELRKIIFFYQNRKFKQHFFDKYF